MQEYPLMIPITWEQKFRQLIQVLDSGYFIITEIDFCAWHIFHPYLFRQNMVFEAVGGFLNDVKMFQGCGTASHEIICYRKPCDSVATPLNRVPSILSALMVSVFYLDFAVPYMD